MPSTIGLVLSLPWLIATWTWSFYRGGGPLRPSWTWRYHVAVQLLRHVVQFGAMPSLLQYCGGLDQMNGGRAAAASDSAHNNALLFYDELLAMRRRMAARRVNVARLERELHLLGSRRQHFLRRHDKLSTFNHIVVTEVEEIPRLDQLLFRVYPRKGEQGALPLTRLVEEDVRLRGGVDPALEPTVLAGEWVRVGGVRRNLEQANDPSATCGVVLYLHGGAYSLMSPRAYRPVTARVAKETGMFMRGCVQLSTA